MASCGESPLNAAACGQSQGTLQPLHVSCIDSTTVTISPGVINHSNRFTTNLWVVKRVSHAAPLEHADSLVTNLGPSLPLS